MANILESPLIIAIVVVAALIIICLIIYFLKQLSDNNTRIKELEDVNALNVKEITEWKEQKKNLPGIVKSLNDVAVHTNALIQANNNNNSDKKNIKKSLKNAQDSLAEKDIFFKMVGDKKDKKNTKKNNKNSRNSKNNKKSKKNKDDSSSSDEDSDDSDSGSESDDVTSDILKELDKKKK